jgi:hypothetical protein
MTTEELKSKILDKCEEVLNDDPCKVSGSVLLMKGVDIL